LLTKYFAESVTETAVVASPGVSNFRPEPSKPTRYRWA
jgi:hypothetical protein